MEPRVQRLPFPDGSLSSAGRPETTPADPESCSQSPDEDQQVSLRSAGFLLNSGQSLKLLPTFDGRVSAVRFYSLVEGQHQLALGDPTRDNTAGAHEPPS